MPPGETRDPRYNEKRDKPPKAAAAASSAKPGWRGSDSTRCIASSSRSYSCSSSSCSESASRGPAIGKVSSASLTAQDLVASFKTMSFARPPLPQLPPPPPPEDNEDALTLTDCMSAFFDDCDHISDCSRRRDLKEAKIDINAAMNTVSRGGDNDSGLQPKQQQQQQHWRQRQHRPQHQHSSHRQQSRRCRHGKSRDAAKLTGGKDPGLRSSHRSRCRRYFGSFECAAASANSPVVEATLTSAPPLERALVSIVKSAKPGCRLFRNADCPQPRWALTAPGPAALATPTPSPSASTSQSSRWQQWPPQPRQQREWTRRHGAACSNCNAGGSSNLLALHRSSGPQRQRSVRDDTADDESVFIAASTVSPIARSAQKKRHLLAQPMPTCHRVRVPMGAGPGPPPPKPHQPPQVATVSARAAYSGLTRRARTVSRHLRAILSSGRHRFPKSAAFAYAEDVVKTGGRYSGGALPPPPPPPPPPEPQPYPQPVSQLFSHPYMRPDANNNRRRDAADADADFGGLLRTLECAQRRKWQRRPQQQQQQQQQRQQSWRGSGSIELLVDGGADSGIIQGTSTRSQSPASSQQSSVSSVDLKASKTRRIVTGHHRAPRTTQKPAMMNRKIDLIIAMMDSLLELSRNLQDCVNCIQGTLTQLKPEE